METLESLEFPSLMTAVDFLYVTLLRQQRTPLDYFSLQYSDIVKYHYVRLTAGVIKENFLICPSWLLYCAYE